MHGLNLYDYSARYMESALGRFTTMDPMAEMYHSTSPYAYCNNNPIINIDPDGKDWFMNQLTGAIFYSSSMGYGDEGKGAMKGKGWVWKGPNDYYMKETGKLENSDYSLTMYNGGTVSNREGYAMHLSMMLDSDKSQKFMNKLGYDKRPLLANVRVKNESIRIADSNGPVY